MYMVGDVEGATMQREAKNAPAMVPVRLLGPIGREGRTAGGSQSGRQRLKGCVSVLRKGGAGVCMWRASCERIYMAVRGEDEC